MMRRRLRAMFIAVYFAIAASEHESMWTLLDSRPVAVLPVGKPVRPLVARHPGP